MAQNTDVIIQESTWTQLTDADVTEITFQNVSSEPVHIKVTVGATAPTVISGSAVYPPLWGEGKIALTTLAPGVSGGNRVWAWASSRAKVYVSHA